ncbi:hypothetical protein [Geoalkalibacter subterraneus]|uniref:Uncharacterized protein n=1 Tax=Geoalkalibacter subterraneus TaxID=483547 RepID=A0A0B5FUH2_9BACT|nr:hypothetical protein [Geoalkalibacter subterraneus]AJF08294.1 hypothetical protein GSUB_17615 [Geoalkalibacter subterraneus]
MMTLKEINGWLKRLEVGEKSSCCGIFVWRTSKQRWAVGSISSEMNESDAACAISNRISDKLILAQKSKKPAKVCMVASDQRHGRRVERKNTSERERLATN